MADMRKDRRAPASLKVKYKSATVDQFIDQFGTDVSSGGMFIKTKTPLEIGALLKLELQLSDASPVIQGIGRVCWRRMPSADPALAPGMGIKFVKLEDASRATVERIVSSRGGAPSRFDQTEGAEIADPASETAPALRGGASETAPALRGGASSHESASAMRAAEPSAAAEASVPPVAKPAPPAAPARPAAPAARPVVPPAAPAAIPSAKAPPPRPPVGVPSRAPGGATGAKPPAPPFTSGAPKPIPSVRAGGATAPATPSSSASSSRVPVAGLFTDSPMARATPEPSVRSSRSSFFPPANGNTAPPAPAGISSRPPPAPAARSAPAAGAFGSVPARVVPPTGPTRAEEEDAIDRMFEEVVQPRTVPPAAREPRNTPLMPPGDDAALDDVLGDAGTVPPRARPPAPHVEDELFTDDAAGAAERFGESWSSASTNALRSPSLPKETADAARADELAGDEFGEADIGGSSAPAPAGEDAPPVLSLPSLSQPAPAPRRTSPILWLGIGLIVLAVGGFIYMKRMSAPPAAAPNPSASAPVAPAPAASAEGAPAANAPAAEQAGSAAPAAEAPAAANTEAPAAEATAAPAAAATVSVEVSSVPRDAEILLGGKPVGNTPMRVALPVGVESELTVRSPGYAAATQKVTASNDTKAQRFTLEPLPYSVTVTTDPPGAELSYEGRTAIAPGPLELGHLDGGASISVAKSGYQRISRPVRLEEFFEQDGVMRAQLEVRLSPLPGGSSASPRRSRSREAPPPPEPAAPGSTGSVTKTPEEAAPQAAPAAPEAAPAAPAAPEAAPEAPAPPTPPALPPQ